MPSKIDGNASNSNTVQVNCENINANGYEIIKPGMFFTVGDYCDTTFE